MNNNIRIVLEIFLVVFLGGGGLSMTFENRIGDYLKNKIVPVSYIFQRFAQLDSYHANTIVLAVKRSGQLQSVTLRSASPKANLFFGMADSTKDLINRDGNYLLGRLKKFMKPEDYQAFAEDQKQVFQQYSQGQIAHAEVPVVFNDSHPSREYRGHKFLPMIVTLGPTTTRYQQVEQLLQIVYLDLEDLIPIVKKYNR